MSAALELKYCELCGRPFVRAVREQRDCQPCIDNPPTEEEEKLMERSFRIPASVRGLID